MALRTHAVAGINADYFDIGQTNQPLGIVVRDGALLRTPSRRVALDVDRDGHVMAVATAKLIGDGAEALGFGIPVQTACAVLVACSKVTI